MLFILTGLAIASYLVIYFIVPDSLDDSKFILQIFAGIISNIAIISVIITLSLSLHIRTIDIPKEYREIERQLKSLDSKKGKELKETFLEHVYSHNDVANFWIGGIGKIDLEKYTFQED